MDANDRGPEIREQLLDDAVPLRYREWCAKAARGTVVCVHGIRSHGAWYLDSCAHLRERGYNVLFPDRRGSGLNRELEGGRAHHERWIGDIEGFVEIAGKQYAGKPVHLLGISWGGRLAAVVAARGKVALKSVIFSSPGLVSLRSYPLVTQLSIAASLVFGADREYPLPLEDPALFTDDPDEQNYIEEDAFGMRRASARFLYESRRLERLALACFRVISMPMLLLLAGRDEIVDNEALKALFSECVSGDKVMKVYQRARHTLEFDACRGEYFDDLVKWLDSHN